MQHYAQRAASEAASLAITFTATTTASGSLLVGSSREMAGYEDAPSDAVVQAILDRATKFVPGLAGLQPQDSQTRWPSFPGGLDVLGWGHKAGQGLCLRQQVCA